MIPIAFVQRTAEELMAKAAIEIPEDYLAGLRKCADTEKGDLSAFVIQAMLENYEAAKEDRRAMCGDTGLPRWYVKIGNEARIEGGPVALETALRRATARATTNVPLRPNRVHPLWRTDHNNNVGIGAPEIEYAFHPDADWIELTTVHKGGLFGSDYRMLFPGDGIDGIRRFYLDTLIGFGKRGLACQPAIVGVGLGGSKDTSHGAGQAGVLPARRRIAQSRPQDRRAGGGAQGARQLASAWAPWDSWAPRWWSIATSRSAIATPAACRCRCTCSACPRAAPARGFRPTARRSSAPIRCGSPTTCAAPRSNGSEPRCRRRSRPWPISRPFTSICRRGPTICANWRSVRSSISTAGSSPRAKACTSARSRRAPECRPGRTRSASPISIARRRRRSIPTAATPSAPSPRRRPSASQNGSTAGSSSPAATSSSARAA